MLTNLNYYYLPDDANDWYRFTLESAARVRVVMTNYVADGQIVVYRGACTRPTILKNNGDNQTTKVVDLGSLEAGSYLIWVIVDSRFSSTVPYSLRVETQAP